MKDYDVIVIGGGRAGIAAAFTAKNYGKKVLLIEKDKLGGECTWNGCIPAKAFIFQSKYHNRKRILNKVRAIREDVAMLEDDDVFREKNIDVIHGFAKFIDPNTICVNDRNITGSKFILATGNTPRRMKINGVKDEDVLTNIEFFELSELPKRMLYIGAGPVACELAQASAEVGIETYLMIRGTHILKCEDLEISEMVKAYMIKSGVKFLNEGVIQSACKIENGYQIDIEANDKDYSIHIDKVCAAIGKEFDPEILGLSNAGVEYDRGIIVDSHLRTSNKSIYAAGDVIGPLKLAHYAEYQGNIAAMNIAFHNTHKANYGNAIWSIFTTPEIAHLGLMENDVKKLGKEYYVFHEYFRNIPRAIAEQETQGFIKAITDLHGKILGVSIIGKNAGELIHQFQIIKTLNKSFEDLHTIIVSCPTYSEAVKKISEQYMLRKYNE